MDLHCGGILGGYPMWHQLVTSPQHSIWSTERSPAHSRSFPWVLEPLEKSQFQVMCLLTSG